MSHESTPPSVAPIASVTNGWDAIVALNAAQINALFFQQYLQNGPTNPTTPLRAMFETASGCAIVEVTLGPPDVSFAVDVGAQQLELTMLLVNGRVIHVDRARHLIESAVELPRGAPSASLTGTVALSKVTGEVDGSGVAVLDLGTGDYVPRISWLDPSSALAGQIGGAVRAYFAGNDTTYPLGTITTSDVPACLQPTNFQIVAQSAPGGSGDGAVLLLIQTNGSGGTVGPQATFPISEGYTAELLVSNEVLFNELLPAALTTLLQPLKTTFAGAQHDGVWRAVGGGGAIHLGVLGDPNGDAWSSDSDGNPRPVTVPIDAFAVDADAGKLAASWNHSWDQEFAYSTTQVNPYTGYSYDVTMENSNRIGVTYDLGGTPTVDPASDVVSFVGNSSVSVSSDSPSWWQKTFELYKQIPDQIKSKVQSDLEEIFANFRLPSVDVFALSNLLFPQKHTLSLQHAVLPGDLRLAGELSSGFALSPAIATLQPGQTQQFGPTAPSLGVTPSASVVDPSQRTQQLIATSGGRPADVEWTVIPQNERTAGEVSIDDSGLCTLVRPATGNYFVVKAALASNPDIVGFALVWAAPTTGPVVTDPIVTPAAATVVPGGSFALTVSSNDLNDIVWYVDPPSAGSIATSPSDPTHATFTAATTNAPEWALISAVHRGPLPLYPVTSNVAVVTVAQPSGLLWEIEPATGSGSISSTGLYTAPSSIAHPEAVVVTGVARSDASLSARALVVIAESGSSTGLDVTPADIVLTAGQSFTFSVTWASPEPVCAMVGLTPNVGTIVSADASGETWVYTAPTEVATATTVTLTALTENNDEDRGTATITLLPQAQVQIAPDTQYVVHADQDGDVWQISFDPSSDTSLATVAAGNQMRLTGASDTLGELTWLVCPADVGTIATTSEDGSHAVYTAPQSVAAPTSVTVAAYGVEATAGAGAGVVTLDIGAADSPGTWTSVNLTALATTGTGAAPSPAATNPMRCVWQQSPQVVYRGQDGHVYLLAVSGGVWTWSDLSQASGAEQAAAGRPVCYPWENDPAGSSLHVVYHGADGHLHELRSVDGVDWTDADLTPNTAADQLPDGDPAVAVWDDDPGGASEHVLYRGKDNHVHELYCFEGGGAWQSQDLTWVTGDSATPAGDPAAFVWDEDPAYQTSLHVAYRGSDDSIHEYRREAATWAAADLTALTSSASAPATGDPVGVAWNSQPDGSTVHWYYIGTDGFVRELWRGSGDWAFNDLSTTPSGPVPPAAGELGAYVWDADPRYRSSLHVTFRGQDDDIHDLWFREWEWATDDLTTLAR